jgi:hypothetical protein
VISQITDKVLEEMADWCARLLDSVYAAVFIDAVMVKRSGTGRWPTGPSTPPSALPWPGSGTSWGAGVGRIQVIRP